MLNAHRPNRNARQRIDECDRELRQLLTRNKVLCNKEKTETTNFQGASAKLPTVNSDISVCSATVPLEMPFRDYGVYLGSHIDMWVKCRVLAVACITNLFASPEYVQA